MRDVSDDVTALAGAETDADWDAALEDIAERRGYYDPLGADHLALFTDAGPELLVTFEEAATIRARPGQSPLGWTLCPDRDWSRLVLVARRQSWFRDPEVYRYFDRLADDGFFDEFDRVVVHGAGHCGYAAAAFSVAAPGATLVLTAPQATLTPALAGWDRRFSGSRRLDFTSRYGYAPDMTEAAARAFLIHDPAIAEDAMHAALFHLAGAEVIRARHHGARLADNLEASGALAKIVTTAMVGRLDRLALARALRARRDLQPYLRGLLDRLEAADRPALIAALCRNVVARKRAPRFRQALRRAEAALARTAAR